MQLAIFFAMLMLVGQGSFTQLKPLIEQYGGEEGKLAVKQAEELSQIISAVDSLTAKQPSNDGQTLNKDNQSEMVEQTPLTTHPLDPVKNVADEKTLSILSKYIAIGE